MKEMKEVIVNNYARCMVVCDNGAYEAEVVNAIVEAGKELGDWFKCKTLSELIGEKTGKYYPPSQIGQILSNISYNHLCEKRIVDDGVIEIEDTRWVVDNDSNNEPVFIDAFDKNGRNLGQVCNPYFNHRKSSKRRCEKYKKLIHREHTEYRFT